MKLILRLSAESLEKLAVLADATERLENFDPFILDTEMTKSPYYFSIYLQVTQTFEIFGTKILVERKREGQNLKILSFDSKSSL